VHRLAREQIGPETVVALLAERSPNLLAAMIAVQRAGAAFLCLDPALPAARLAKILNSSGAPLLLAAQGSSAVLKQILPQLTLQQRLQVATLEDLAADTPADPPKPARRAASSLAYVIYTSGSSGTPKGVMIEQQGLSNHLASLISVLDLSATDVIAQTAPQSFVISVWQHLAGLMVGARVHICANEIVQDPVRLAQEIATEGVTILQIVPSLLRAILERAGEEPVFGAFAGLRLLIATGEPLTVDLCRAWFRHFPGVPLIDAYGASECSDDAALHRLTQAPASMTGVPIGRPLPNTRLYVLDSHLQPVPIGVVGELCVGGAGVGRGYVNDLSETSKRFLRDPFAERPACTGLEISPAGALTARSNAWAASIIRSRSAVTGSSSRRSSTSCWIIPTFAPQSSSRAAMRAARYGLLPMLPRRVASGPLPASFAISSRRDCRTTWCLRLSCSWSGFRSPLTAR
jgi:amino acid adenylation domain-containing protein